jgi:GPH family glycoside/pentoside/hexuronide:cation symporter
VSTRHTGNPDVTGSDLTWSLVLGWSVGTIGPVTILYVVNYAGMFFMTDVLGISAGIAGSALFAVRLYDLFADPVMGIVSDRTRSRMGRRRPWMLLGGLVTSAGCIALFNAPTAVLAAGHSALITWSVIALVAYFTGYSMFNVPYLAMPAEMTESYHGRTWLMSARVFFVSVSSLLGVGLAPRLVGAFGGARTGYGATATLMALISLAAMLGCVAATRGARATDQTQLRIPAWEQLRVAFGNRPFLFLILAKFLLLFAMASLTTTMFYFATNVLHRGLAAVSNFGIAQTFGMLASLPIWVRLGKRHSKQRLFMVACAINSVFLATWLLATPAEPMWVLLLRSSLIGASAGGALLMGQSLLPDTMEYDYRRSGLRREGAFAGAYSFVEKAGFAFGPLVVGWLLTAAGYHGAGVATSAAASADQTFAVYLGVAVIPAVATLLSVFVLSGLKLNERVLHAMVPPDARASAPDPDGGQL